MSGLGLALRRKRLLFREPIVYHILVCALGSDKPGPRCHDLLAK